MKRVREQGLLAGQDDYDFEELALEWFDRSVEEMDRRNEMTAEEIWVTIGEGGDHFFPSIDEMIADRGIFMQPHNREQLSACLGEYSLKLDQCDLGLAKADNASARTRDASNPISSVMALREDVEVLTSDDAYWDLVSNEIFYTMNRVLHSASSMASSTRETRRACRVM